MPEPGHKVCPYCAEEIREAAVICRFCKSPQPGADPSQLPPGAQAPAEPVTEEMSAKERELVEQVNRLRQDLQAARNRVSELEQSTSWSITAPLRAFKRLVSRN